MISRSTLEIDWSSSDSDSGRWDWARWVLECSLEGEREERDSLGPGLYIFLFHGGLLGGWFCGWDGMKEEKVVVD